MPNPPSVRLKLLKALTRTTHRYDRLRALAQTFSIAVLLVVPLSGLARVDVWGGSHRVLFKDTTIRPALAGVIIGIVAMYVVTFLSNAAAGRLFCGWGCPVGQISRFGEAVDAPGLSRGKRIWARLSGALFSGAFVIGMMAWWVDLRVFVLGSPKAMAIAWAVLGVATLLAYGHGRFWRWKFCKNACPIGMYYSVVSPAKYYGVHFRNQKETCIECDACDHVCPVDLAPRDLMAAVTEPRGLSTSEAPGRNHCLECGDCVRACEFMVGKRGLQPIPLKLGWFGGPQRVDVTRDDSGSEPAMHMNDDATTDARKSEEAA